MKNKFLNFICFFLFIFILMSVFFKITYLFRDNQYSYLDRISVVGIKEEWPNSIDVIYIGGSAAFTYYDPLIAYRNCGFTSYDLATNTLQAESILSYIKYAQKYQNPNLYVIDVRPFQYYDELGDEIGLRISTDALDIGINRGKLISRYLINREKYNGKMLPLFLDIIKYHTNEEALSNPLAWNLSDNSYKCEYKGAQIQNSYYYLDEPKNFQTTSNAVLLESAVSILQELLDYLKENRINAVFVVCPYYISENDEMIYNSIEEIILNNGFDFLNANSFYDEMNLNFATDFKDHNHVNALGAEKYTEFLAEYIQKKYVLPDHRDSVEYDDWNSLAEEHVGDAIKKRNSVELIISNAKDGFEKKTMIESENNFSVWCDLVADSRYSYIVVGNGKVLNGINEIGKSTLSRIGLSDIYEYDNYACAIREGDVLIKKLEGQRFSFNFLNNNWTQCDIDNTEESFSIKVEEIEYSRRDKEGINIVVFDNTFRKMIDTITIKCGEDGNIIIER